MGLSTAQGIIDASTTLAQGVALHFKANCYPPVPLIMVECAVKSINLIRNEEGSTLVDLPDGVEFRNRKQATAYEIAEGLRLDAFLMIEEEV